MLIEELRGSVDVVVCSSIGSSDNHNCQATGRNGWGIHAVVVDGGFEEVGVVFEPVGEGQTMYSITLTPCITYHLGRFNAMLEWLLD
jgi:hypothetical protein